MEASPNIAIFHKHGRSYRYRFFGSKKITWFVVIMSALGPGCVKTRRKSENKKVGLSERPLCDFLGVGKGDPTRENLKFLRFYTA
jgi:hypothetical protein